MVSHDPRIWHFNIRYDYERTPAILLNSRISEAWLSFGAIREFLCGTNIPF